MKRPRTRIAHAAAAVLLLAVFLQIEGCYYLQAIRGHSELMSRRRPVAEVLADESSPEALRTRLALVTEARDFAVSELLLPDNDSYRTYADLERDYVVWNVFAAPEFSLQPKTWCFPVAGCVAYRGYFAEESARAEADRLEARGYDVAIGGVAAYSTLGRFADPLLNTMMRWSDVDLVVTMFHELAHQKLYIKDDSAFNESFATAVAEIGIERWLARRDELERLTLYRQHQSLRMRVNTLVADARQELAALYESGLDDEAMRGDKRRILDGLSAAAAELIEAEGSGAGNWLAAPLNNARLVSISLYQGKLDSFRTIYADCGEDMACFYDRARAVAELGEAERNRALETLLD